MEKFSKSLQKSDLLMRRNSHFPLKSQHKKIAKIQLIVHEVYFVYFYSVVFSKLKLFHLNRYCQTGSYHFHKFSSFEVFFQSQKI